MKAERRHELQTNELALWLRWRAPQLLEKHGTRILLGVVFLVLVIVLVRYRLNAPNQAAQIAADNLTLARQYIDELNAVMRPPGEATQAAKLINDALEQAESYSLPGLQPQAYLALGDYYWALASFPELPQAATRPVLRPDQPREQLLKNADEAYARVLSLQTDPNYRWAAAHLGRAAVAEQQASDLMNSAKTPAATQPASEYWTKAREHYQAVAQAEKIPQVLRDEAKRHLDELEQIQQPVYLAAPTPATNPTTQPLPAPMMGPTTAPASTQPVK